MDLEEQIQLYCLSHIKKYILILLLVSVFIGKVVYFFQFKEINNSEKTVEILQGSSIKNISSQILVNSSSFEENLYYIFLSFWNTNINKINFGEFKFDPKSNLIKITQIISKPSNVYYKLTIIDGWQEYQLSNFFKKKFGKSIRLNYHDVFADTYNYKSTDSFEKIIDLIKKNKISYFTKNKKNMLLKKYSIDNILIIASLVEKEGVDYEDKKIISSVIINRLEKNMKLQIDASTIFSITKGKFKYNKKLSYEDLKIVDDFNTYYITGLPPNPICYVGRKTIDIVLENHKSDYLFYFFNEKLNQHIYSKTFKDHKKKLQTYRENE